MGVAAERSTRGAEPQAGPRARWASVASAVPATAPVRPAIDHEKGMLMASDTDPSQAAADEDSYEGADVEVSPTNGEPKAGGLGADGTIPDAPNGVAAGHSDTASNFNAEED
ncbi:hypothetical protein [Microbacterium sp. Bi128]|uniref:hypothetical protein n=1 Tax=Microbacterium sp. Bi128 TaxID=2821115 RepID=UPI001E2996F9|nr:hypothetical protein [Microbacterium sp. Bi128]